MIYRSWYYFRAGYGTYISLPVGVASSLVVFYELALVNVKSLRFLFPSLTIFAVEALVVFIPVSIALGLYHMKRTGIFATDAALQTESNPYIYKITPGKEQEVTFPLLVLTAKGLAKVLDQQRIMTADERREFDEVLAKAKILLEGQPVGILKRNDTLAKLTGGNKT